MNLHRVEEWCVSTSLRAWMQRRYEAPRMFAGIELPPGAVCLEIGCGQGVGVLLINGHFPGCQVIASD